MPLYDSQKIGLQLGVIHGRVAMFIFDYSKTGTARRPIPNSNRRRKSVLSKVEEGPVFNVFIVGRVEQFARKRKESRGLACGDFGH